MSAGPTEHDLREAAQVIKGRDTVERVALVKRHGKPTLEILTTDEERVPPEIHDPLTQRGIGTVDVSFRLSPKSYVTLAR